MIKKLDMMIADAREEKRSKIHFEIDFQKQVHRQALRLKRKNLPLSRRQDASRKAYQSLAPLSNEHTHILSYASFACELNTWKLNNLLAERQKLILPYIENEKLRLFLVTNLSFQLKENRYGILEPNPMLCKEVDPKTVSVALVPGLGFDPIYMHRIGYGKGYYDRLLYQLNPSADKYGIGFHELEVPHLPFSDEDFPLTRLMLF